MSKTPHRIEGQLDGLHYQNILQNVTVPSVWMLYPEVIIHLQQDHSSNHATGGIQTHNLSKQWAIDRPATGTGEQTIITVKIQFLISVSNINNVQVTMLH